MFIINTIILLHYLKFKIIFQSWGFGVLGFSLFLLFDFNLIAKGEYMSNNWDSAFELAFTIYLDIINLLLEILEAMDN